MRRNGDFGDRLRARGRAGLERVLERDEEVVLVGRGVRGDLAVDLAREHELDQRLGNVCMS